MARTVRPLLRLAAVGAAVATASGCGMMIDPDQADDLYAEPSDGVQIELTERLRAENLLLLTSEEGAEGVMSGALVNDTYEDAEFQLVVAEERLEVEVPAQGSVLLGIDEPAELDAVPAAPGSVAQVTLSTSAQGGVTAPVPVLDDTLPPYEDIVP